MSRTEMGRSQYRTSWKRNDLHMHYARREFWRSIFTTSSSS